jgi:hypothetical protein
VSPLPESSPGSAGPGPPRRKIPVPVRQFAAAALSAAGEPTQEGLERTLSQAVHYYLSEGEPRPPGWAVPKFLFEDAASDGHDLEVPLEPEAWQLLLEEAKRQEVEPDRLLQHAALYFAAARDSGRLTGWILEEIEREEGEAG